MRKKVFVLFFVFVLISISVVLSLKVELNAENASFYNSANTFNLKNNGLSLIPNYDNDLDELQFSGRYDMSYRNDNVVDNGDPLITFITHGLNGSAGNWSNMLNCSLGKVAMWAE